MQQPLIITLQPVRAFTLLRFVDERGRDAYSLAPVGNCSSYLTRSDGSQVPLTLSDRAIAGLFPSYPSFRAGQPSQANASFYETVQIEVTHVYESGGVHCLRAITGVSWHVAPETSGSVATGSTVASVNPAPQDTDEARARHTWLSTWQNAGTPHTRRDRQRRSSSRRRDSQSPGGWHPYYDPR